MMLLMVGALFAGTGPAAPARADDLEEWLDTELIPHLEARFGRHPRLEGEPFHIRVVRDAQVVARMNGLGAYIRQRISDALQSVPGANLLNPIPPEPWTAPQKLSDLRCPMRDRARVRLTVEAIPGPEEETARVVIQALDLRESKWIPGVRKVWQGPLTPAQQRRLRHERVDHGLLGTRELPFTGDQPDLLSARLAASVGCALRRSGRQEEGIDLVTTGARSSAFFSRVDVLLRRYLSALQGVRLVDEGDEASTRLTLQIHRVDAARYQVWTSIGEGDNPGLVQPSAVTYVLLDPAASGAVGEGSRGDDAAKGLIALFELVTPPDSGLCDSRDPWSRGRSVLDRESRLGHGDCFAVRFRATQPSRLYLFTQTGNLPVQRLLPNDCSALHLGPSGAQVQAGQSLHIPLFRDGSPGYFRLDRTAGIEHVHALVVPVGTDHEALRALVEQTADPCTLSPERRPSRPEPFRARLEQVLRTLETPAERASRSLIHVEAR